MDEKHEGTPGMEHLKKGWIMKKMLLEQLDDEAKKQYALRRLDEHIMKKEFKVKLMEHKIETLRMMKKWVER
ncbi:MAG TPA: hypothetical protein VEB88_03980 [Candidatus Acidoferrales bacterium]|jgi:hypothetical protein|nr:hypothetical protein [Candidatus Acidoferrales bacterium]